MASLSVYPAEKAHLARYRKAEGVKDFRRRRVRPVGNTRPVHLLKQGNTEDRHRTNMLSNFADNKAEEVAWRRTARLYKPSSTAAVEPIDADDVAWASLRRATFVFVDAACRDLAELTPQSSVRDDVDGRGSLHGSRLQRTGLRTNLEVLRLARNPTAGF